jgi:hypothetical protein
MAVEMTSLNVRSLAMAIKGEVLSLAMAIKGEVL